MKSLAREVLVQGAFLGAFCGGFAGAMTFWVFVWHYFGKATGWW